MPKAVAAANPTHLRSKQKKNRNGRLKISKFVGFFLLVNLIKKTCFCVVREEIEAPPGYVQSLINKIVSNIRIYCNNLILKYVEEDIVLSMNVKLLSFESANEKWEAAYTGACFFLFL